jgi:prepilin-type N-terminal cleavage/methylation domain-containing protein
MSRRKRAGFTLVELPAVSRGKRTAFTLVELLVVIGIIAPSSRHLTTTESRPFAPMSSPAATAPFNGSSI